MVGMVGEGGVGGGGETGRGCGGGGGLTKIIYQLTIAYSFGTKEQEN